MVIGDLANHSQFGSASSNHTSPTENLANQDVSRYRDTGSHTVV